MKARNVANVFCFDHRFYLVKKILWPGGAR